MAQTNRINGHRVGRGGAFLQNFPNLLFPSCVSTVINESLFKAETPGLEGPNGLLPARGSRARHCINSVA